MKRIAVAMVVGLVVLTSAQADTYGRSERVRVVGTPGIEVDGLLDPAAKGSSLRAAELKYFNRGGGTWVRFTIDNGGVLPGSRITFERPVLKDLKIRQRDGSVEHRAQVALSLCVGRTTLDATLTVSDRSGYTAPLTIGGGDLRKLGAVDPAREYTIEPNCGPVAAESKAPEPVEPIRSARPAAADRGSAKFSCDGRQHCSQMNSRAEAQFFVHNCPDTKMDGDHDGIACENDSRW